MRTRRIKRLFPYLSHDKLQLEISFSNQRIFHVIDTFYREYSTDSKISNLLFLEKKKEKNAMEAYPEEKCFHLDSIWKNFLPPNNTV